MFNFVGLVLADCEKTVAALDLGSGTTKVKVYNINSCTKEVLGISTFVEDEQTLDCEFEKKVSFKESLVKHGELSQEVRDYGLKVLKDFYEKSIKCGATIFKGVATSAFRQAPNGHQTIQILSESGFNIKIISQKEEALIGFYGALGKPITKEEICMWDIGGSSLQIVCGNREKQNIFLSNMASVPFKNILLLVQQRNGAKSPNPISYFDYQVGRYAVFRESSKVPRKLKEQLRELPVYGIGGVHYYAVSKALNKEKYSSDELYWAIFPRLYSTDRQLGGGDYVDTSVSNIILVQSFMDFLNIPEVEPLKVNLTEGVALLD